MENKINPSYYQKGNIECIDAIKAATEGLTGFEGYLTGCSIKYLWRWAEKGGVVDLSKAQRYIDWLISEQVGDGG